MKLPLPPSANVYWRSIIVRGSNGKPKVRVLLSRAGRAFKAKCKLLALAQRAPFFPRGVDVAVRGTVYLQDRRSDLDNRIKPTLDALASVCYANDRQVAHIDLKRAIDKDSPRVELEVEEF